MYAGDDFTMYFASSVLCDVKGHKLTIRDDVAT